MTKKTISIALAYVGVIVGAGLSSGQDLLQYFVSFGSVGMVGVVLLGLLNIVFGRIILALGSYYRSDNHQEVLDHIAHPVITWVLDIALVISCFVIGFVMIAGAGANLKQQFGLPSWVGALLCAVLIIVVSFLDFERITTVLGIFTPMIVIIIALLAVYTFVGHSYDFSYLNTVAHELKSPMPNIWISVINYFALCAMTGVSMAFVLGGSIMRIGVAERAGALGGGIIGIIIAAASVTLFARIDVIGHMEIPMLALIQEVHPALALLYALVIFALIFNTAFSLFYALARRVNGSRGVEGARFKVILIAVVAFGFVLSFAGFKQLVSLMYPILGYLGIVLLIVLLLAWVQRKQHIIAEKLRRRKMISLAKKRFDDDQDFTMRDKRAFDRLGRQSVVDTDTIKHDIAQQVKQELENQE